MTHIVYHITPAKSFIETQQEEIDDLKTQLYGARAQLKDAFDDLATYEGFLLKAERAVTHHDKLGQRAHGMMLARCSIDAALHQVAQRRGTKRPDPLPKHEPEMDLS